MPIRPNNTRFSRLYRRVLYRVAGGVVLLLTTTGRKSGREHTVGLQYEQIDGRYYVAAADGEKADWLRNVRVNPFVLVQAGKLKFCATAAVVSETSEIAGFLAYRLKKRPLLIRLILRADGLKGEIDHAALEKYAQKIRLVILTPSKQDSTSSTGGYPDFSL